jgi:hypothetical protein
MGGTGVMFRGRQMQHICVCSQNVWQMQEIVYMVASAWPAGLPWARFCTWDVWSCT